MVLWALNDLKDISGFCVKIAEMCDIFWGKVQKWTKLGLTRKTGHVRSIVRDY